MLGCVGCLARSGQRFAVHPGRGPLLRTGFGQGVPGLSLHGHDRAISSEGTVAPVVGLRASNGGAFSCLGEIGERHEPAQSVTWVQWIWIVWVMRDHVLDFVWLCLGVSADYGKDLVATPLDISKLFVLVVV